MEIIPFSQPVKATIDIPGSKSYTNRALIMAALTKGPVVLEHPLYCDDTEAMVECLQMLGIRIDTQPDQIIVYDDISVVKNKPCKLFARDSGTTMRFLLPLLCRTPGTKMLQGSVRLNERPIKDLADAMRSLGAKIDYLQRSGQPPLQIYPSPLGFGSSITIDASMSSQFVSALLMAAPLWDGLDIRIKNNLISRPYLDMTISAMRDWGINVVKLEEGYHIASKSSYRKQRYVIEGDYSSAGYFFAMAALTHSTLTLTNLPPQSVQADRRLLDILAHMGNKISISDLGITITGKGVHPIQINMEDCPDQVQTVAVLAAFAEGTSRISGVRSLRVKETERVQALKNELAKMGIKTEDTHDALTIYGGYPRAAEIETYGDHRMAMAFAVAGAKLPGLKINNPQVVNKTFPSFWQKLRSLHA